METIVHFSHKQHPLALCDQAENEDQKLSTCSICELPILSSPSYTCTSKDCKFLVHKPCAQLLPRELNHPYDSFGHRLSLHANPRAGRLHNCQICSKRCGNFAYTCEDCDIDLHPLCARPVEIKIKHESHNEHPLVAICRELRTMCNACGEEHLGFFFFCQECDFWIHRDCALLPSIVKHVSHSHPLIRTYSLFYLCRGMACNICEEKLLGKGIYFCAQCARDYVAHTSCATSNMENLTCESRQELITHMPDEGTTFPSLIVRILEKRKRTVKDDDDDNDMLIIKEHHNHPLVFHDNTKHENQSSSSKQEACLVQESCDVCIQPINILSPFWGCTQPGCHFSVHNFCKANIPYKIDSELFTEPFAVLPADDLVNTFFHSVFQCLLCSRPCNGYSYYSYTVSGEIMLCHLECISAPATITHASHGREHVLIKERTPNYTSSTVLQMPCCSDKNQRYVVYRCVSCDFMIHITCALLPKKGRHKFDKHHLELMFDWPVEKECCFCEFCEEDIDQQYWFYHCSDCDQSFHINCIPSVGRLSRVKFGGTLHVPCHPRHPVALTRMFMESNQRCGYCKEIIPGFVDDMAFYCSECEFWIHFGCARDCCVANDGQYGRKRLWYELGRNQDFFGEDFFIEGSLF